MKGYSLIIICLVLLLVMYLVMTKLKKSSAPSLPDATGIELPERTIDLPSHVEKKVKNAANKAAERTEKALEDLK